MGPDAYRGLPERLKELESGALVPVGGVRTGGVKSGSDRPQLAVLKMDLDENYEGLEQRRSSKVAAWVPIQRGCDHRCTFCIVPYVRGGEKNRDPQEVLDEIREIADSEISEVTLLGQTVNSYRHGGWDFPRLLREVARVPGIRRVRFTSPHPNDVTAELVEAMAEEAAVCENLHLPVQSGDDRVLKRMVRRHTVDDFLKRVEMVRGAIPDISLSTDVIVAFPGETEEAYQNTLELMRTVRFDDAFTYRYSPREGTPATRLPPEDSIPEEVGQARLQKLIQLSRGIQAEINRSETGREEEVLVEKVAKEPGQVLGRTRRNKVVAFTGEASLVGSYLRVRLERTSGATFAGSMAHDQTAVVSP
jgi:tRNA-2-methylthio-N6-dimethylallyladenosine synthase